MSQRRKASVVVALAVASLAATSAAAMVASSELLVESFGGPVPRRLEPPAPDLGTLGTIQVEPPKEEPTRRPAGRSRPPATKPSPRQSATQPVDRGEGGVIVAVQRRPARQEPAVARKPVLDPPPPPPLSVRPASPRPAQPEPWRPHRPRRRWTARKPHPAKRVPTPQPLRPARPHPADPEPDPGGRPPPPCSDGPPLDQGERRARPGRHRRGEAERWSASRRPRPNSGEHQAKRRAVPDRPRWDEGRQQAAPDRPRRGEGEHRRASARREPWRTGGRSDLGRA